MLSLSLSSLDDMISVGMRAMIDVHDTIHHLRTLSIPVPHPLCSAPCSLLSGFSFVVVCDAPATGLLMCALFFGTFGAQDRHATKRKKKKPTQRRTLSGQFEKSTRTASGDFSVLCDTTHYRCRQDIYICARQRRGTFTHTHTTIRSLPCAHWLGGTTNETKQSRSLESPRLRYTCVY